MKLINLIIRMIFMESLLCNIRLKVPNIIYPLINFDFQKIYRTFAAVLQIL